MDYAVSNLLYLTVASFSPPGSDEERTAVERASQHSSRSDKLVKLYQTDTNNDVRFAYRGGCEQNGDITIHVSATNTSTEERRTIKVNCDQTVAAYINLTLLCFPLDNRFRSLPF